MKSRFLNIISIALVATLSLETTGCNVAGSRAAAVTAGVLLGVGVGAQAATHSSVEVKIDVYEPSDADDPLFKLNHALAVRQVIDTGPKQASPAKLLAADKELQPKMNRLKGNLDIIGETVSALQNKNAPLAAVAGDMKAIQEYETEALKAWSQFEDQLADASADGFPKAEVQDVADKLNVLRKSLRKISAMRLQPESVAYIQLLLKLDIIRASHLDKNGSDYANKVTDIQAALKNAWDKLPEDSTATTENQIIRTLDAARGAVADNPDAAAFIDSLKKNLDSTADPKTLQNGDAGSGGVASFVAFLGAVKDSKDVSETAITITIDALTAGINLGPISNDVMQFVVGQRRLLSLITRDNEDNEGRWHCFTRCFSRGGTGNNDTVFYMENMALPVLKSATFDPSKFLAADGSIYKQALASLGAAAQQKTTGASSGTTPASATGNKAAKATPKSKPGGAAGAGGNGGKVASAPSSNIEGRRDSSDR
ncbi:MAG TPA: hypothetical protein VFC46_07255, partial [Humisphaera sp.]|nr:hypothetical protein [Humisphaera sp.]